MKNIYVKAPLLIFSLYFLIPVSSTAEPVRTYIRQSYIDSLMNQAIYLFSSIGDPGSGVSAEKAIANGKQVALKLRDIAKYDVNKKYILWRVNELEAQIFLEESGLLQEKEQWRQKNAEELIQTYNSELCKSRPGLSKLWNLHKQMLSIDTALAHRMERSITKRAASLSEEIIMRVDSDLETGRYAHAREEIAYCEVNRTYLSISPAALASMQARLLSNISLEQELRLLNQDLDSITHFLNTNTITNARNKSYLVKNRLSVLKSIMIELAWKKIHQDYIRASRKIVQKEDSLIKVADDILKKQGFAAAGTFLDTLKLYGVSQERIAGIDRKILEAIIIQNRSTPIVPVYSIYEDTSESSVFQDLILAAKNRAIVEKETTIAQRQENARLTHVAETRRDRLQVTAEQQQKRDLQRIEENKRRARQELLTIYTLIESNRLEDAVSHYEKVKDLLQAHLTEQDFQELSATVKKSEDKE